MEIKINKPCCPLCGVLTYWEKEDAKIAAICEDCADDQETRPRTKNRGSITRSDYDWR